MLDRHSARREGLRRRAQAPGEAKVLTHRAATLASPGEMTGIAMPAYGEILSFLAANPYALLDYSAFQRSRRGCFGRGFAGRAFPLGERQLDRLALRLIKAAAGLPI